MALIFMKNENDFFELLKDTWEGDVIKKVEECYKKLEKCGKLYEKDGAIWFKSSEYGDDQDRVLKKADGSNTYLTADIAYHIDKIERGFMKR